MDSEWRPYTVPYTGSGATKDESNNWVPSSTKNRAPKACPPPPHGCSSTCWAPAIGEDRETTAAEDGPSSRNTSQRDDGPYIPSISRVSSVVHNTAVPDRFRPSQHGTAGFTPNGAGYANPGPLVAGDESAGKTQSKITNNTQPCHRTARVGSDSSWIVVSHPAQLDHSV